MKKNDPVLFAVYGTLRTDVNLGYPRSLWMEEMAEDLGPCKIRGDLYSVSGSFPGLRPGSGVVRGQLWRAKPGQARKMIHDLDQIESYREFSPHTSMYLRVRVPLVKPIGVKAFTYVWNMDMTGLTLIPSGDWETIANPEKEWLEILAELEKMK